MIFVLIDFPFACWGVVSMNMELMSSQKGTGVS